MSAQRPMTYEELLEMAKQLRQERDELLAVLREFFDKGYTPGRSRKIKSILSRYPEQP